MALNLNYSPKGTANLSTLLKNTSYAEKFDGLFIHPHPKTAPKMNARRFAWHSILKRVCNLYYHDALMLIKDGLLLSR
jgi:hypothetical protein